MADKSRVIVSQVNQSQIDDFEVIPGGKSWVLLKIGGTDGSKSSKPSSFKLYFGSGSAFDLVRHICVTTGTIQIDVNKEYIGDGVKHFRLVRESMEAHLKEMPFWFDAYEK